MAFVRFGLSVADFSRLGSSFVKFWGWYGSVSGCVDFSLLVDLFGPGRPAHCSTWNIFSLFVKSWLFLFCWLGGGGGRQSSCRFWGLGRIDLVFILCRFLEVIANPLWVMSWILF